MNLNGWATLATLRLSELDRLLAWGAGDLISTFNGSGPDPATGGGYTLVGALGPWTIAPGSVGTTLRLQLTVAGGTFTVGGVANNIAGTIFVVAAQLVLVPVGGGAEVRFAFAGPGGNPAALAMESCSNPSWPALPGAMLAALGAQGPRVSFVLATASGTGAAPVATTLCIGQPVGAPEPGLAILSGNPGAPTPAPQIPAGLISPTFPASFALSQDLFMGGVVARALPGVLPGTGLGSFGWTSVQGISLTVPFNAPTLQLGVRSFTPIVRMLGLMLVGGNLTVQLSGSCSLNMPGAQVNFQMTAVNAIGGGAAGAVLTVSPVGAPSMQANQQLPWSDYLFAPVASAVAAGLRSQTLPWLNAALGSQLVAAINATGVLRMLASAVTWGGGAQLNVQTGTVDGAVSFQGTCV